MKKKKTKNRLNIAFCANGKNSKAPGYPTSEVKDMVCWFNTIEAKIKPETYQKYSGCLFAYVREKVCLVLCF